MLRSVLEDCVGILCQTESLSIAAAPLLAYKPPIGFLYLEATNAAGALDEGHLRFLMAVGAAIAAALENRRHVEHLQEENRRLQREVHADIVL